MIKVTNSRVGGGTTNWSDGDAVKPTDPSPGI